MADYVIRSGDTLSAIAQRLGTTVQALAQANGIANPDRIQAGATLRVPDAPGAAPQPRPAGAPAPTTGAMPRPRPQQVAAMDPMSAPLPQPNPTRGPPPVPPPNPMRPGVGSPSMGTAYAGGAPGTVQPQRAASPAPLPPPGNGVGVPTTPVEQGRGLPPPGPAQPIDITQMSYQQLNELASLWMSMGRDPADLPPQFNEILSIRRDQHELEREMAYREAAQLADQRAAQYRMDNGTNPRIAPPAPPVDRSIGEGEYLPQEMVRLGQLGANMQGAPANPMLGSLMLASGAPMGAPVIGGFYQPPQQPPSLGQLARRPWPGPFGAQPYLGV